MVLGCGGGEVGVFIGLFECIGYEMVLFVLMFIVYCNVDFVGW